MQRTLRFFAVLSLGLALSGPASPEEAASRTLKHWNIAPFSFAWYLESGGGAALLGRATAPLFQASSGIRLGESWAIGGFVSAAALAKSHGEGFLADIADREGAYYYQSGAELTFTPYSRALVHPFARASIGGMSLGYPIDSGSLPVEGKGAVEKRRFAASLALGAEANISAHLKATLKAGYRLTSGGEFLGLGDRELSGPELGICLRLVGLTVFD